MVVIQAVATVLTPHTCPCYDVS